MAAPRAMLPTPISPSDFAMISEPAWAVEAKVDGYRKLVTTGPDGAKVFSRSGAASSLPAPLISALSTLEVRTVLDGEFSQGRLHLFDLPFYDGLIDQSTPWARRHLGLRKLLDLWSPPSTLIEVVPFVRQSADKIALLSAIQETGGEGIVAKRIDSAYTPGYSTAWLKLKLQLDADCIVGTLGTDRQNMELLMLDNHGEPQPVGRCSRLTGDGPKVKVGDVVTVRTIGLGASGRLIEPVTPRRREDKRPAECTLDQLASLRRVRR